MSRNFSTFTPKPYIGLPFAVTSQLGGPGAKVVPLNFDWKQYHAGTAQPNTIVTVGFQYNIGGPQPILDKVISVYIDNTGSDYPVYFICADTGYTVTVQPDAAGWYPVFTNQLLFNVAIAGVFDGNVPTTKVFISNSFIPPFTDPELQIVFPQYKGSPVIQRTNSLLPGFGAPALGDQVISNLFGYSNLSAPPSSSVLLPQQASGFYYITALSLKMLQAEASVASANLEFFATFFGYFGDIVNNIHIYDFVFPLYILGAGANNVYFPGQIFINGAQSGSDGSPADLLTISGMNLRLDARTNYGLVLTSVQLVKPNGTPTGNVLSAWSLLMSQFVCYTLNPT